MNLIFKQSYPNFFILIYILLKIRYAKNATKMMPMIRAVSVLKHTTRPACKKVVVVPAFSHSSSIWG